jgi:hypothetical protein
MEQNLAKGKILQIFKYLQALNQLRNPVIRDINLQPWSLWYKDLPNIHPFVKAGSRIVTQQLTQIMLILQAVMYSKSGGRY